MMEEVLDSEGDIFFNNGPVGLVKFGSKTIGARRFIRVNIKYGVLNVF